MNPITYWLDLVEATKSQKNVSFEEAQRLTSQTHRDAGILARAYGATGQTVQFFNSRLAGAERTAARTDFQERVRARMDEIGCSYDSAFGYCQRNFPQLLQTGASFGNANADPLDTARQQLSDAAAGRSFSNASAVKSPAVCGMFRLPVDTTQTEFDAAWHGNGDQVSPIDPGKIFAALVSLAEEEKSMSPNAAVAYSKSRFKDLWDLVEQIAASKAL